MPQQSSSFSPQGFFPTSVFKTLWYDESSVILSDELVLVCTILVLGLLVGIVELQCAIGGELSDLGSAFGTVNQSYNHSGFSSSEGADQFKARTYATAYIARSARRSIEHVRFMVRENQYITGEADTLFTLTSVPQSARRSRPDAVARIRRSRLQWPESPEHCTSWPPCSRA